MSDTDRAPALSVVVPIHDERDNLEPLVAELTEILPAGRDDLEIVLVDDGSTDGSGERIAEIARLHAGVRGVWLRRRHGQTAALDAGFKAARGRFVVTIDGDLQNDPRDIPRLVAALENSEVAVGYRADRHDPWRRRVASRLANAIRNGLTGDDIIDTGCTLKAFRRECLTQLTLYSGMHRFLPTLLRIQGRSVVQLPVNHRPRRSGRSKYGIGDRMFTGFADLLAVRWMLKRRLDYEIDVRRDRAP